MNPGYSMSNLTHKGVSQNRRISRSNSTSSSMVTLTKTTSLSSPSNSRGPFMKARPASPEQVGFQLTAILTSNPVRSNSRPNSVAEARGQNINGSSHSTSSSISGLENDSSKKHKSNSARRLSIGPIHSSTFLNNSNKAQSPHAQKITSQPRRVSQTVAPSQAPPGPPPKQPVLTSLPKASHYRSSLRTPSTATATPGTAELLMPSSYGGTRAADSFGDNWHSRGPVLPGIGVGAAEPMSGFNPAASPLKRPHVNQKAVSPENTRNPGRAQRAESRDRSRPLGHSTNMPQRDRSANDSVDTTAGSSMASVRSDRSRNRGHRSPTQKTMLSKALAKANTAVLLDNAQNFEGAVDAYTEACDLLRQVMLRSSDDEDRKKLSAIRSTYSSRITELKEVEDLPPVNTEKALPRRPGSIDRQDSYPGAYYDDEAPPLINEPPAESQESAFPPRRQSLMPSAFMNLSQTSLDKPASVDEDSEEMGYEYEPQKLESSAGLALQPPRSRYARPLLSPRRPPSPPSQDHNMKDLPEQALFESPVSPGHARDASTESTSWLDTIDESASSASSASSRLSSLDFRPSIGSNLIDQIEADLDAALSAAVEAAYHDGSRPGTTDPTLREAQSGTPVTVHRDSPVVDSPGLSAQEEALSKSRTVEPETTDDMDRDNNTNSQFYDDDADEEERLLEEMAQGYGFGDFHFDKQSKSALPRQSDSSGFSGRTWPSSNGSTTATNATSLSTLAEIMEAPSIDQKTLAPPPPPPPVGPLPARPVPTSEPPPAPPVAVPVAQSPGARINRSMSTSTEPSRPSFDKVSGPGVRDRRLSGQNAKQLKIETYSRSRGSSLSQPATKMQTAPVPIIEAPPATEPLPVKEDLDLEPLVGPPPLSSLVIQPLTPIASIHSASSLHSDSPATPALTQGDSQNSVDDTIPMPGSPGRFVDVSKSRPTPSAIRKNMSQSSLRMRNLSVATIENTDSPVTPASATFPHEFRKPTGHAFTLSGAPIGGMYLFDDHIGTPNTPRTPRTPSINSNIPAPLEPCPESFMLRPFWLMRCLYQTIAHPRGGYITTNLFVPRDIWRVKNVKLKAVEDKIAQSDLLSAALLRLANVDQLDAEAVLEEMQAFETVIESVRVVLQKKLGSDVGLAGSVSMFKGVSMSPEDANDAQLPKAGGAAKLASSWRKLRSKSSAAQLNAYAPVPQKENAKGSDAAFTIPTIPMTSSTGVQSSRTHQARRNPASLNFSAMGVNANYMAALVRLFDASQILDSIARQVEDPGLKCSSKTHVGLELCVRNASEFFAFFVVRWVIADVGNLVDKFVKRGGEWVMS